jgi:hypothetical protein
MRISTVLAMVVALSGAVAGLAFLTGGPPAPPPSAVTAPPPPPPEEADFHLTNPFTVDTKAANKPVATAETVEFKFDAMAPNEERTHKFKVKNTGEAQLQLAKGRYQCKCTMPTMKKGEFLKVEPGEETEIEMTWKPLAPDEMFMKTIEIWTNDPDHPKLTFTVQGSVIPHIMPDPSSYSLGLTRNEKGGTFEGYLVSRTDGFEIVETSSDNPLITATVEPVATEAFPKEMKDAKTVFRVKGTLAPSDKVGPVNGMLTFKTNLEAHKEVVCGVNAQLMGPFSILGFGWDQTKTSLDLERVDVAKGAVKHFAWFVPKGDHPLEITSMKSEPNFGAIKVTKDETFTAADREKYDLAVEVLPGAPKGEWNLSRPIVVTVKTNHPRVPEVAFKILYRGY